MKSEVIKEKIQKAKLKIEKKKNTIIKKENLINKKNSKIITLNKTNTENIKNEIYYLNFDINIFEDDIARNKQEITEIEKTLNKYNLLLKKELKNEEIFNNYPPILLKLEKNLAEKWDISDFERKDYLKNEYNLCGYSLFIKKYKYSNYLFIQQSNEEVKKNNLKDAKNLVLDLYKKVKKITGEVTDWSNIIETQGSCGFITLNGTVIGKEGKARIESILAGGYNIQKLHIRVLVKEII